ncbi:MAG: APC family permease [Alphaproteobacteria bacterium]|nr:APC family permease [Alphaproteobacteria bacterium]
MNVRSLLIGRKLANREGEHRKITAFEGLPAMGLDGLGSSAYGPEAALTILLPLGAAGLVHIGPIMIAILIVLAMLYVSYWQTIEAYPSNGGSYTVAKENLGTNAGLLAATALMIDYVLNVAVGISAGIGALTSAVPALHPYTLELCLAVLLLVTVVNLRGTLEAGLLFAVPTYLFVASFGGVILYGLWLALTAAGSPQPVVPPPAVPAATEGLTLWLLLRAFASGCTAMTGVEAVSNGVSAFREPTVTYAHRTLTAIVLILGFLLAGIAYLAHVYGIAAMDQTQPGYQSVLSQLAQAVIGRGPVYFVAIGSLLAILCLSANTSFVDFPRLCRLVARDEYLPRAFAIPGDRLVYSVGILWLAVTAGALLTAFGGITDRLIPLFAVGAFLSFTLSQSGMAVHWAQRLHEAASGLIGNRTRLAINAAGAASTGASLIVILAAKFVEGAWITVLAIPCVLILLKVIRRYYAGLDRRLGRAGKLVAGRADPPIVVIPVNGWNRLAERAVRFAVCLSPDVTAVHLTRLEGPDAEEKAGALRHLWRSDVEEPARSAGVNPPRLVQIPSPYRSIAAPLLKFILQTQAEQPNRPVAVVIPTLVRAHWWDYLLHTRRVQRLRTVLMRHGGPDLAVLLVPWAMEEARPEAVIAAEEPEPIQAHPAAGPRAAAAQ